MVAMMWRFGGSPRRNARVPAHERVKVPQFSHISADVDRDGPFASGTLIPDSLGLAERDRQHAGQRIAQRRPAEVVDADDDRVVPGARLCAIGAEHPVPYRKIESE